MVNYKQLKLFASDIMPLTPFVINEYTKSFVGGNFSNSTYEIINILNVDSDQIIVPEYQPEIEVAEVAMPYKMYSVNFYNIVPNVGLYISIKPYRQEFNVDNTEYFQSKLDDGVIRVEDFNEYVDDVKDISIILRYQAGEFILQIFINDILANSGSFVANNIQEFYSGIKELFKEINYYAEIETNFQFNELIPYLQYQQGTGLNVVARYEKEIFYAGELKLETDQHDFVPYPVLYDMQGLYLQNQDELSLANFDEVERYFRYFNFQDKNKYGNSQSKFSIYNMGKYNGFLVNNNIDISYQYLKSIMKYGYLKVFTNQKPEIYGLSFKQLQFSGLYLIDPNSGLPMFNYLLNIYDNIIKDQLAQLFEEKLIGKRNIEQQINITEQDIENIPYLTKARILSYETIRKNGRVKITMKLDTILQNQFIDQIEINIL